MLMVMGSWLPGLLRQVYCGLNKLYNRAGPQFRVAGYSVEAAQVVPGINAAVVAVAEGGPEGVVADDFPAKNADAGEFFRAVASVLLPEDVFFSDVFRAGGVFAQVLGGEVGFGAVLPADAEFSADELDVLRVHGCVLAW